MRLIDADALSAELSPDALEHKWLRQWISIQPTVCCEGCAHCAGCDIQQMLSPFVEDWSVTGCSSWCYEKTEATP